MAPTYPLPEDYFSGASHVDDGVLEEIINDLGVVKPTAGQKAALVGSSGTPSASNPYATSADPRLTRSGTPELDMINVVGGAAVSHSGGDVTLVGRNLLQGQTFDSLALTQGAASVTVHALKPGDSGITAQVIAGAGALGVTYNVNTKALVITLAAGGSTDDAVATAINANAAQCNGYVRAVSAGGGSLTTAVAATALAGGVGDWANNKVMVGGLEALPANETGATSTAKWSNTGIICTSQAVGAATDIVAIAVQSNAVWSQSLSSVLA